MQRTITNEELFEYLSGIQNHPDDFKRFQHQYVTGSTRIQSSGEEDVTVGEELKGRELDVAKSISITEFSGQNDTDLLRSGVKYLCQNPGTTLTLENRDYHIHDDFAKQLQYDVMHGKYGINPEPIMFNKNFPYSIGLDFTGANNVTLDGNGARIFIDGFMETVSLQHCNNVTLKNLSFDLERKPYSRGEILSTGKNGDDIYTDVYFPNQSMINADMSSERYVVYNREMERFDNKGDRAPEKELIAPNTIRIYHNDLSAYIGQEVYMWHTYHYRPTIFIFDAQNTVIEDVRVHSNGGMGIVGHRSKNILMRRFCVVPSAGEGMSTNGDATHFTSCKGLIRFENCLFEGQGDDATNVHTYYHTILNVNNNICEITVQAPTGTHGQKADYPDVGDILELSTADNLAAIDFFTVTGVEDLGDWVYRVTLDHNLPDASFNYEKQDKYLANTTQLPSLEFIGCNMRNHLARSVLIKTRNVLIEGCLFDSSMNTAIHICAEGWWREGITSKNVIIRNNRIIRRGDLGFGVFGQAGGIAIEIQAEKPFVPVHENILIENNMIICPDTERAIYASNVRGLTIRNNKVLSRNQDEAIFIERCENVLCENNVI